MYINNLILKIAARCRGDCVLESDNTYHLIYVISKYQKQIITDSKKSTQPEIYLTVADAVANLLNSANADIQMLCTKEPEFSSFANFPAMDRLNDYYDDLVFLKDFTHLWNDFSQEEELLILNFDKTIANIEKEIKHSKKILQTSLDEIVLPKLKKYINQENNTLDKDLVAQMEIKQIKKFVDLYTTKNNTIESKRKEEYQNYYLRSGYSYSTPKYHLHIKNDTINSLNKILNESNLIIHNTNNTKDKGMDLTK